MCVCDIRLSLDAPVLDDARSRRSASKGVAPVGGGNGNHNQPPRCLRPLASIHLSALLSPHRGSWQFSAPPPSCRSTILAQPAKRGPSKPTNASSRREFKDRGRPAIGLQTLIVAALPRRRQPDTLTGEEADVGFFFFC